MGENAFVRSFILVMKLAKYRQNLIVPIRIFQLVKQHNLVAGHLEKTQRNIKMKIISNPTPRDTSVDTLVYFLPILIHVS